MLNLSDSLRLMKTRDFNLAQFYEISDKTGLLSAFDRMQKPVVLKISSDEHIHKTDAGGIALNIKDKKKLLNEHERLKKISKNMVLQEQKKGIELIIGIHNDPVFGQMIMLGIGGVFVELIKDSSFRKLPISKKDAFEMIEELKFKKIFEGYRGMPKIDKNELANLLEKISKLAVKENIIDMDLNPIFFLEKDYWIVDARIKM